MDFYEGHSELLSSKCAAVVGTRNPTEAGKEATIHLTSRLVKSGYTVVSGLARGVDTLAHLTAIRSGGRTIACVPGGLCDFYPPENEILQREIGREHLVIARSAMYDELDFLARNGTIAGLGEFCVVPELLQSRSGSLSTVRRFLVRGKRVFIQYGVDLLPRDVRTHKLLRVL